jgi:hypothetical protein
MTHLSKEFAERGRTDSNPIETMHSAYYQISDRNNALVFGLSSLMLFAGNLENEFADVSQGVKIRYGTSIVSRSTC